ncbi:DUF488 domain-containing protein [Bacillus sp. DTU_2020_1000418_1_SI_GHA_SEK_038]|uniref:DUF488 domain-containing protein n=1 Tax=Bacillus sp. DTU_2020_1000418_1_SI_GHA_SEK_038 TaxID=3077585 RepID=UPI0028ECF808|nr:DUF488 domain-containing protein [Bacillus sp. DTU_2020_1000418_1_SI_GHA_SEK_038]WNS74702.1 DUF488 domain-containing protein [Bacillus sp. DTU_2020_1000418_1_SI_GHA_SEK_038]
MSNIFIKRIYDPCEENDGYRILVDRLWPRGISKEKAKLYYWAKNLAPSHELRKSFSHNKELFDEFRIRYLEELRTNDLIKNEIKQISKLSLNQNITLLYAAKNTIYNNAIVLKDEILMNTGDDNLQKMNN